MADKPLKFIEHDIRDNIVLTNKAPSDFNKDTILIGASKVTFGVAADEEVIKENPTTGLKYLANRVDAQQIFNSRTQRRGKYFCLALETGRGGKSWYPGSKRIASTIEDNVEIKQEMSETSAVLVTLPKDTVIDVIDEDYDDIGVKWYNVKYNSIVGFTKEAYLSNFKYVDREL